MQGIFSSAPAIDENRDRKRRNIGLLIGLADVILIAGFLKLADSRGPGHLEKVTQGFAGLLAGTGALFWVVRGYPARSLRHADKGSGLALLVASVALMVALLAVGGMAAL